MEGDLMRIVLNNNINNNLDVYFQRKIERKSGRKFDELSSINRTLKSKWRK